jgi:hypothetical protein
MAGWPMIRPPHSSIIAGLLVALEPKIGAFVVCAWLVGIFGNLTVLAVV